jgi:hypothetical protein
MKRCKSDLQELVKEGKKAGEKDSHDPETESHDRETRLILVRDNSSDLGNRRVLLFFEDDGGTLGIDLLIDEIFFSRVFLLVGHFGERREGRKEE